MRHGVDGRKFGRNTSHRVAMLKNLANNLIQHEQMITTIEKAKEARRVTEKLITLAKKDTLNSRRLAFARTRNKEVVAKLFDELVPRYKARAGGYTRIVKISETRWGDAAKVAMIELVDHPALNKKKKKVVETGAEGTAKASETTDPFSKFRKLFGQSKKAAATVTDKVATTEKSEKPAKSSVKKTATKSAK